MTDFGLQDNFVGVMKGVLLSQAPHVQVIDLTHQVPPQNIRFGAFQLLTSYSRMPPHTIFVCVVDPGVGSKRKILYAKAGSWHFIAPDNGLLSWVFEKEKPTEVFDVSNGLPNGSPISQTFHGRDIMAPLAAKISQGEDPKKFGPAVSSWEKIPFPAVQKNGSQWKGEVLAEDKFGNLITNVLTHELAALGESSKIWIELGKNNAPLRGLVHSYSEVGKGKLLAIGGSAGFVEIAVRDGHAAQKTNITVGDPLFFEFRT